jgi:hypothetical protein
LCTTHAQIVRNALKQFRASINFIGITLWMDSGSGVKKQACCARQWLIPLLNDQGFSTPTGLQKASSLTRNGSSVCINTIGYQV